MTDEERYEVKALAFKNMTGVSPPREADRHSTVNRKSRIAIWNAWTNANGRVVDAILDAVSQLEVDRG